MLFFKNTFNKRGVYHFDFYFNNLNSVFSEMSLKFTEK